MALTVCRAAPLTRPPTVVLRFEDKKLVDVSSEFRDHYDGQINTLRSELGSRELSDFKASDGRLSAEHLSSDGQASGLLATKIRVLEIVWAYLYSGREQQAWDALDEMWPASDADRVRTAITKARARGLRTQVDGVPDLTAPQSPSNRSAIYEHTRVLRIWTSRVLSEAAWQTVVPQQILVRLPSPNDPQRWDEERQLELVIDEAGKVRSARMEGGIVKDISAGMRSGAKPRMARRRRRMEIHPRLQGRPPQGLPLQGCTSSATAEQTISLPVSSRAKRRTCSLLAPAPQN